MVMNGVMKTDLDGAPNFSGAFAFCQAFVQSDRDLRKILIETERGSFLHQDLHILAGMQARLESFDEGSILLQGRVKGGGCWRGGWIQIG